MKTVFTTGEAAKICKVSQQTIIRCFDNGQLKGFRVPGSRFRRIPREMLYKFMKDNGIPTDALESGRRKVLLVDEAPGVRSLFSRLLRSLECETFEAPDGGAALEMLEAQQFDIAIFDMDTPLLSGLELLRAEGEARDERPQAAVLAAVTRLLGYGELATLAGLIQGVALLEIISGSLTLYPENVILRFLDAIASNARQILEARAREAPVLHQCPGVLGELDIETVNVVPPGAAPPLRL